MAENPDTSTQDPHDADEALKKRLLSRIAFAGVLVVALLGGLAVFDALYGPPQQTTPPTEPIGEKAAEAPEQKPEAPTEEKAAEAPADKAAELAQAEKPEEQPEEAKPAVPAAPERTTGAVLPPPKPIRPLTVPATPRLAIVKPAAPMVAAPQKPEPAKEIAKTAPPSSAIAEHAPASRPLSQAAERSRQFVVQMGVFYNVANAEELRAKLELAGIPAQIEARVQVGPFKTRQEADLAREKLRALGMETGILTAIKR